MTRDERISKLKNGSDTAIWAAEEIERIESELAKWRELAEANMKGWEICQRSRERDGRFAL